MEGADFEAKSTSYHKSSLIKIIKDILNIISVVLPTRVKLVLKNIVVD